MYWQLFVLLLGYNRYAGLRRDTSMTEVAIDSVEEMGIGLFLAALVLFLLGRITLEMPFSEIAGVIVVEAMTVAIGVSVGTAQLGAGGKEDEGMGESSDKNEIHFGAQIVFAFCGAVLFAANLAPTEEIVIIGIQTSWLKLIGTGSIFAFDCLPDSALQRLQRRGGVCSRGSSNAYSARHRGYLRDCAKRFGVDSLVLRSV